MADLIHFIVYNMCMSLHFSSICVLFLFIYLFIYLFISLFICSLFIYLFIMLLIIFHVQVVVYFKNYVYIFCLLCVQSSKLSTLLLTIQPIVHLYYIFFFVNGNINVSLFKMLIAFVISHIGIHAPR